MLLPILLALATAQQSPPPQAPAAPSAEVQRLDGVYIVVNEEAVTTRDLLQQMVRAGANTGATEQERQAIFAQSRAEMVRSMLVVQAGRDLGYEEALVDRLVESRVAETVEGAGSVLAFGEELKREQLDPQQWRELRKRGVFAELWTRSVTGAEAGTGGRVYVDTYVRPGRLLYEFRSQPANELLPPMIQLQEIGISVAKVGSATKALELVEALRDRARRGEDFDLLVEQNSVSESRARRGLLALMPIAELGKRIPELAEFVAGAKVGEVSEPVALRPDGELTGFLLFRAARIERHDEVRFADTEVQSVLRRRRQRGLYNFRRERALQALLEAAYVWPPEVFGRAPEPK